VNGLKTSSSFHGAPEKAKGNELRVWILEDSYYRQNRARKGEEGKCGAVEKTYRR
jgi:hypothetical protein